MVSVSRGLVIKISQVFTHEYQLYTAKLDGSDILELTSEHDLSVIDFAWHPDNQQHYIQYEERGQNVLALLAADGSVSVLTDKLSGWELDQPYVQGQFSASAGVAAVTLGDTITPTELGVVDRQGRALDDQQHPTLLA